eukprot:GHVH01015030.1.p1 GENE.GHVH01015030.1~~GHVH01015030.1.p1  ORF type:complete len:100 (-),score=17.66 GHVH01015030.1:5-304(-)
MTNEETSTPVNEETSTPVNRTALRMQGTFICKVTFTFIFDVQYIAEPSNPMSHRMFAHFLLPIVIDRSYRPSGRVSGPIQRVAFEGLLQKLHTPIIERQ